MKTQVDEGTDDSAMATVTSRSISSLRVTGGFDSIGKEIRGRDLADQVHTHLLKQLGEQGLPVPQRLNVANIAQDLGVSRTPVTMALVRLECEGLVRRQKDLGWVTVQPGLKDIGEIYDIRAALDALLIREATENVTPEAAAVLMSALEDMEGAASGKDVASWREADHRFHSQLHELVSNQRILHLQRQLEQQLSRVQVLDMVLSDRMQVLAQEHRAIAEAVVAGDVENAVDSYLKHTSTMRSSVVDMMHNIIEPLLGRLR